MKKILLIISFCIILSGCKGVKEKEALKELKKVIEKTEDYTLVADMEIISNEEKYLYEVNVTYKKGPYYRVILTNKDNSYEQIILKNDEGVYVVTPSLNKSFKFQSAWPYNSSQSYILETLLSDIENDEERIYSKDKEEYIWTTNVNYPNNSNLINQKIIFDKNMNLKRVDVLNSSGKSLINLKVKTIEYNNNVDKELFTLASNVDETCCDEKTASKEIEDVIYPMYLPSGTVFDKEEVINNDDSKRVILTFTGEKSFIIVEEAKKVSSEHETTSSSGDIVFYENILGYATNTSFNWSDANADYYIIGQNLTTEELLQIAASTTTVALMK